MDTTTKKAPLRARDITITELGVWVNGENWGVPTTPASMDRVDPKWLQVAKALKDTPIYGTAPMTRADKIAQAEERRAEAQMALDKLQLGGIRAWAAEQLGIAEDAIEAPMLKALDDEFKAKVDEARKTVAQIQAEIDRLQPGRGQSMDDDMGEPEPLRKIKVDILARYAGYIMTLDDETLAMPYVPCEPESKLRRVDESSKLASFLEDAGIPYVKGGRGIPLEHVFFVLLQCPEVRRVTLLTSLPHEPLLPDYHYRYHEYPKASEGFVNIKEYGEFYRWAGTDALEKAKKGTREYNAALAKVLVNKVIGLSAICSPFAGLPAGTMPGIKAESPQNGGGKSEFFNGLDGILQCSSMFVARDIKHGAVRTVKPTKDKYANIIKKGLDDLVCDEGRGKERRAVHFENVTGSMDSDELAQLITSKVISHRGLYRHGSEDYPNHKLWCISSNNLDLSTDEAGRVVPMPLDQAPANYQRDDGKTWAQWRDEWIEEHRNGVIGDILGVLKWASSDEAKTPPKLERHTRFPGWDEKVVRAVCHTLFDDFDDILYRETIKEILKRQAAQDSGSEYGQAVEEAIADMFVGRKLPARDSRGQKTGIEWTHAVRDVDILWIPIRVIKEVCQRKGVEVPFSALQDAAKSGRCQRLVVPTKDGFRLPSSSGATGLDEETSMSPRTGWFYYMPRAKPNPNDPTEVNGLRVKIMKKTSGVAETNYKPGLMIEGEVRSRHALDCIDLRANVEEIED